MSGSFAIEPHEPSPTCSTHPDELAGWRCHGPACRKSLCGACTAKNVNAFQCSLCGAAAGRLVVPRASRSYVTWLVKSLAYPITRGIVGLAIIAIACGVVGFTLEKLELAPGKVGLARGLLILVYGLAVADGAARGNVPERGALMRIGRGLVATLVVWAPAALYLWMLGIPARGLAADRIVWLYAGLAALYVPIAVATASTDASYADAAHPFKLAELAWHLGRRYLVTLVTAIVLGAAAFALAGATIDKLHRAVPAPVATDVVAMLPLLAVVTAIAYAIGLLPFVHGDRFGWADASRYADPLHPKLVASGKRKVVASEPDADQSASAALALAERNDARKVHDALKEDAMPRALRLYEARATWSASSFDDGKLVALGKGATRAKRHDLARRILDEALARSGRGAGQAMIALAQLHAQMGDAAAAAAMYRRIVAEHPGSDAAKAAALKLKE